MKWSVNILNTTKVPDDLTKEVQSISCMIQPIMDEEDAEEMKGMLNSVSALNQVTPEDIDRTADRKIPS